MLWASTAWRMELSAVVLAGALAVGPAVAGSADPPWRSGRTPSARVGSAMAVLATLEQAQVLPPEGTNEATRIVQDVIQLQSAFTQSTDPALRAFTLRALTARQGARAAEVLQEADTSGWTAELLVGLAEEDRRASEQELRALLPGLARYNMSVEDVHRLMRLVRDAVDALREKGLDFHRVFAEHRRAMPGAGVPATPEGSGGRY